MVANDIGYLLLAAIGLLSLVGIVAVAVCTLRRSRQRHPLPRVRE
ncbi:hypothetical protein BH11PSE3_BH11PSE3_02780 [soil metagenome]